MLIEFFMVTEVFMLIELLIEGGRIMGDCVGLEKGGGLIRASWFILGGWRP